ncbi:MAG: type IIL restriction-modification enzyme MmeI [Campylobacter sp.]|uniref:type IIL restriction-modification enzyme MmeI n=1 Tax=Campylobacter sp. TaxID=205 RepID=UPI002A91CEB9|nr:type IIL restriction-modification enzyme MmeI [Campylobacter sp.]MDY5888459.1 type IIL restriction-modification enzyme MmeI [Campylobacter sp.]
MLSKLFFGCILSKNIKCLICFYKLHLYLYKYVGRLKRDYRYSNTIVYNNFPFASLDEKDKETLTATAQGILDARAEFGDCSLADLYNPLTMPANLRKAHERNDQAVLKIYAVNKTATPSDIVKELFTRYGILSKNTKG